MSNRLITTLSLGFCLFSSLILGNALAQPNLPKGVITVANKAAPPLVLENMDQEKYDLKQSTGKWVFVHFWASWCGPCRKEMPTVQAMASHLKDPRLEIVLINTAEDEETIFSFMGIVAPELNTLMDPDGLVTEHWQPRGLPATFLVNPEGNIEYVVLGGRPWNKPAYLDFLRSLIQT